MTLELIALAVSSFAAGFLLNSYLHDAVVRKWKFFVLALVVLGCISTMTGILMRVETEKTKARVEQVKELRKAMEAK